ncbi:MAG: hypothetical protein M1820_001081 [Bogoriella megaspora]|nr:MAG: hypothetical protein M1820_001081 [Bogoriella megaspora]
MSCAILLREDDWSTPHPRMKRKRTLDDEELRSGGKFQHVEKRGRSQTRQLPDQRLECGSTPNFACPYLKKDPQRYGMVKSCLGPNALGWNGLNRLKEHLYRRHFLNICCRCHQVFTSEKKLRDHLRAEQACSLQLSRDYADGFDERQRDQIKRRKDKGVSRDEPVDEQQHWRNIFGILFPGSNDANVPSAFHNVSNTDDHLVQYDSFCQSARYRDATIISDLKDLIQDDETVMRVLEVFHRNQTSLRSRFLEGDQFPRSIGTDVTALDHDSDINAKKNPESPSNNLLSIGEEFDVYEDSDLFNLGQDVIDLQFCSQTVDGNDPGTDLPLLTSVMMSRSNSSHPHTPASIEDFQDPEIAGDTAYPKALDSKTGLTRDDEDINMLQDFFNYDS